MQALQLLLQGPADPAVTGRELERGRLPAHQRDPRRVVAIDPVAAAKLELYSATRDQAVTERAPAERLGLSDSSEGRLTDPDHCSDIGLIARALRAVGRGLVIEDRAA